ncbi:hypothetical protein HZH68_002333 [Vespula germanica]|uniref:Uncharacterized protein n=1 Tax=Vespula germanica TaxID=30212 RepID=A0A834KTP8_VESGE|nr:hypothetical protein HZH68_002333 [Vespula germanica]
MAEGSWLLAIMRSSVFRRNVARRVAGGGGGSDGGGGSGGPNSVLGGEVEEKGEVNFTTLSYKPKDLSRES